MRRFLIVPVLVLFALAPACGSDGGPDDGSPSPAVGGLVTRSVQAGEVDVEIDPVRIDSTGAEFDISFDTHSVDLGIDVASEARLEVADVAWKRRKWTGDPSGGHHREGTLTFDAGGPARGTAELTISGLPESVSASWTLDGSDG